MSNVEVLVIVLAFLVPAVLAIGSAGSYIKHQQAILKAEQRYTRQLERKLESFYRDNHDQPQ